MKQFKICMLFLILYSCKESTKANETSNLVFTDSSTLSELKAPDNSLVNTFGLKVFIDSINKFTDKLPAFLYNPCFDCGYNLSGKAMGHGPAINPSARYEIIQAIYDTAILKKIKEGLNQIPRSFQKPYAFLSGCRNQFDSIEHSSVSIIDIIDERMNYLRSK